MGLLPRDWNPDSAQYKNTLETLPCVGQHALYLANFEKRSETPATSGQLRTDRDQGRLMFLVLLHQTLTVGRLCSLTLSMSIEYGTQRRAYPQPKLVCTDHVTIPSFLSPEAIPLERSNFLSLGREFVSYFQPIRFVRFALSMRRVTDSPWIKDFWFFHLSRGFDSWCWPKGAEPLGMKMPNPIPADFFELQAWDIYPGEITQTYLKTH